MLYEFLDARGNVLMQAATNDPQSILNQYGPSLKISNYRLAGSSVLDKQKWSKWQEIKKEREDQKKKGFLFNGVRYDGDEAAQTNIANASLAAMTAKMLGQDFSIAWTAFDNTIVVLSADELLQMQVTMTLAGANIQFYGTILREKINAATTQEELDAIEWRYNENDSY